MSEVDILQKIVDEEGSCTWADERVCRTCPLSRLKTRPDGNYISCLEAVGGHNTTTEEESDALYLNAALKLLMDVNVQYILEGKDGADRQ